MPELPEVQALVDFVDARMARVLRQRGARCQQQGGGGARGPIETLAHDETSDR